MPRRARLATRDRRGAANAQPRTRATQSPASGSPSVLSVAVGVRLPSIETIAVTGSARHNSAKFYPVNNGVGLSTEVLSECK
jgi:hypothetical protein